MFRHHRVKPAPTATASTEPKKPLTIYITHGNALILKMTARRFSNNEHQLIATYSADDDQFLIENNAAIKDTFGIQIDELPISENTLVRIINQIKQHSSVNTIKTRLVCDANLGTIAGHNVTPLLRSLIKQIKPTSLIPFTETPECVQNAELELSISISTHKTVTANITKNNMEEFLVFMPPIGSHTALKQSPQAHFFGCCSIFRTNAASITYRSSSDSLSIDSMNSKS